MKDKMLFALERSLDAAKELLIRNIDQIFAAYTGSDNKIQIPIVANVMLTGEGKMKFSAKMTYKGTDEIEVEYDPDQMELDFDFSLPGSNFGKLDLQSKEATEGDAGDWTKTGDSKVPPEGSTTDAAESSPELFS